MRVVNRASVSRNRWFRSIPRALRVLIDTPKMLDGLTAALPRLSKRPKVSMAEGEFARIDILSDVLRVVRLTGSVFFVGEFSAPWSLDESSVESCAKYAMPGAEHVVMFHILVEGECHFEIHGMPNIAMETGDVIIFPHRDRHKMSSGLGARPTSLRIEGKQTAGRDVGQITGGGGGEKTRFICGYLNCDQKFNPLLTALPNVLIVRARDGYTSVEAIDSKGLRPAQVSRGSGSWLGTTLKFAIHEANTGHAGNGAMLGRLTELMFVELLRQYMRQLSTDNTGWLAGLNDPQVGKALAAMHAAPARSWTVDELARAVGVSRSVLAQRFSDLVGESPMRYLATWRVHLAKEMLRDGMANIAQIAANVGYDSEAAFNRAFKRAIGQPPAAWRRKAALAAHAPA